MKTSPNRSEKKEQPASSKEAASRHVQHLKDLVSAQHEILSEKEHGACCMATD